MIYYHSYCIIGISISVVVIIIISISSIINIIIHLLAQGSHPRSSIIIRIAISSTSATILAAIQGSHPGSRRLFPPGTRGGRPREPWRAKPRSMI